MTKEYIINNDESIRIYNRGLLTASVYGAVKVTFTHDKYNPYFIVKCGDATLYGEYLTFEKWNDVLCISESQSYIKIENDELKEGAFK